MKTNRNLTAQALVAFAAVCWGLLGIFTRRLTVAGFSLLDIVVFRNLISAVCLVSFLLLTQREKLKLERKDIKIFAGMGGFGLVLNPTCYFMAINLLTLSAASILLYTSPYMVMILSALVFKEKVTKQKILAMLIAFSGCMMTVGMAGSTDVSITGIATGLTAAFFYSLYTILGKTALRKYSPVAVTAYSFAAASILLLPFSNFGRILTLIGESGANLTNLLSVALFTTLLPFACYIRGLAKLEPGRAAIISFVEPLTAAIAGIVVFNEMFTAVKITGAALILLALIILNLKSRKTA